jgi:hypothetical protein
VTAAQVLAAKAHHIPPAVAKDLGWVVVAVLIAVVVIGLLRLLRIV